MKATVLLPEFISLAEKDEAIDCLWLYGSQVKGNANQHSDCERKGGVYWQ